MSSLSDDRPAIAQERRVLQALCQGDSNLLKTSEHLLSGYRWCEPIHQIIFNCLAGFAAGGPLTLREQLAACATRKGFPDVDWEEFFPPHPIPSQQAEALMRQLLDLDSAGLEGL